MFFNGLQQFSWYSYPQIHSWGSFSYAGLPLCDYQCLFKDGDHLKTTACLVNFQTLALFLWGREQGVCYLNSGQNYWPTGPIITDLWRVCTRSTARTGSQGDRAEWGGTLSGLWLWRVSPPPSLSLPRLLPLRLPSSFFKAHHWGKVTVSDPSDAKGNNSSQFSRHMSWSPVADTCSSLPDKPAGLASRVPQNIGGH